MTKTTERRLVVAWQRVADQPVVGWDFDELDGRMFEEHPTWDYAALCRQTLRGAQSLLDLGTGGGEFLLTLTDVLPADTVATAGWEPNVAVARTALAERDIPVVGYDSEAEPWAAMPFTGERFSVVLSRHEAYDVTEVARVLTPGGTLLTQQVGGDDVPEILAMFGVQSAYPEVQLDRYVADARRAGLTVDDAREWRGALRFVDVAAFVRYLTFTPWILPEDFTVDRYREAFLDLHKRGPAVGEPITVTQSRFVMRARRGDAPH